MAWTCNKWKNKRNMKIKAEKKKTKDENKREKGERKENRDTLENCVRNLVYL